MSCDTYFGKLDQPGAAWFDGFTEVARKNLITSVNWSSRSSMIAGGRIKPERHSDESRKAFRIKQECNIEIYRLGLQGEA